MAWFKVDDRFASSKPVLRIPRRYRAAAVGLWTLAGTWSAQEELDGFVPDYMLDQLSGTEALARTLVSVGLWEVVVTSSTDPHQLLEASSTDPGVPGWRFRNWGKYQPTKVELDAGRERERIRKAAYRASQRDTSGTDAGQTEGHQRVSEPPVPSRPGPARPGDQDSSTSSLVSDREGPEVDLMKVKSAVQKNCGRECSDTDAYRIIGTVLERAKQVPKHPTAFVTGAIARDPFEFQKLIDEGADS